ncbi:hypothetical protein AN643_04190 [Candidatus Epulonipiscioides saccharophilum]|nr:hypothetical protein AN643_04190 [Epulopiscium sp. SCG-B10WGA-EpuloB]
MDEMNNVETFLLDMAAKCKTLKNENKDLYQIMDYLRTLYEQSKYLTATRKYDIELQELEIFLSYLVEKKPMKDNP